MKIIDNSQTAKRKIKGGDIIKTKEDYYLLSRICQEGKSGFILNSLYMTEGMDVIITTYKKEKFIFENIVEISEFLKEKLNEEIIEIIPRERISIIVEGEK